MCRSTVQHVWVLVALYLPQTVPFTPFRWTGESQTRSLLSQSRPHPSDSGPPLETHLARLPEGLHHLLGLLVKIPKKTCLAKLTGRHVSYVSQKRLISLLICLAKRNRTSGSLYQVSNSPLLRDHNAYIQQVGKHSIWRSAESIMSRCGTLKYRHDECIQLLFHPDFAESLFDILHLNI